jgi:Domain of unknown function (DUF3395)/DnaJ domain
MTDRPSAQNAQPPPDRTLYVLLNVPANASSADIRVAFRRLSRQFHPDKHTDPVDKAAANDTFTRIKEAHEILSSDKLRRVYDAFGLDAARAAHTPGMDLVPFDELAARFRGDAQKNGGAAGAGSHVGAGRDPYFTISNSLEPRLDATGLVAALDDGYDWVSFAEHGSAGQVPLAILTQVSLSTKATAYLSPKNTLTLQYSLLNRPRAASAHTRPQASFPAGPLPSRRSGLVSAGELAISLRRMFSQLMWGETAVFFPLDPRDGMTLTGKVFRSLSDRMSASLDASYGIRAGDLTLAISSSRQFDARTSANISWAAGASSGVSFSMRKEAFDEYIDPDVHSTDEHTRASRGENESSRNSKEDNPMSGALANKGAAGQPREILPVSALLRILQKPLAVVVSPHVWAPVGGAVNLRMGLADASIGLTLRRPIGRATPWFEKSEPRGPGGGHLKVRAQLGIAGWELEAGGGRRYIAVDTYWSTSVAIGTHGVMLRLKLTRSGNRFQLPIVLVSTTADARVATIAAIATSSLVSAVQILVVGPWRARRDAAERDEVKRSRAYATEQAKTEAEASRELMRRVVLGSIERETSAPGGGLLILRAIYGLRRVVIAASLDSPSFAGREIVAEVTEVGDCVQALVEDSRVQIIASSKSTMLGFWDPTALDDDERALRIWYKFRETLHDCIVSDDEPLELPLSTHRITDQS